ncbi:FadR/GntR family transcriptional regulator [Bifidobacterium mongoliense]|uniref:FadR/GntR family transcriptional regulator n=1 Tax=Bifidobacterium mongoliense TaxID=518643 RepID=UPI0030EB40BB
MSSTQTQAPSTASDSRVFLRTGKTKSAEIAAILERKIHAQMYSAGARLPGERELAKAFGVSRNTVREALDMLERRNLVATKWGSGTVVLGVDEAAQEISAKLSQAKHDWGNVSQLRYLVEPGIARLAATTATDADLITMHDEIEQSSAHLPAAESLDLDIRFHLLLAQSTGNPLIAALMRFVNESTQDTRLATHETDMRRQLSLDGHRRIFDCISRGDAQAAEEAMLLHLQQVGGLFTAGHDQESGETT